MKAIIITIAALTCELGVAAMNEVTLMDNSGMTPNVESIVGNRGVNDHLIIPFSSASATVARAEDANEWKELGKGTYTDFIFSDMYGVPTQKLEVTIEESLVTPGVYRINDPYVNYVYPQSIIRNTSVATPLIVHANNPDSVWLEEFIPAATVDGKSITVKTQILSIIQNNGLSAAQTAFPGGFGNLTEGVITYPPILQTNNGSYYNILAVYDGKSKAVNKEGDFRITLPGAVDKDLTVRVEVAACAAGNKHVFTVTKGADIPKIKFGIFRNRMDAIDSNYSYVAKNGNTVITDATYERVFTSSDAVLQVYTVFAVGVDDDGNVIKGDALWFYHIPEDSGKWSEAGTAIFTDDIIASVYENFAYDNVSVPIQQHTETAGYYRLVNPYHAVSDPVHDSDHNHYIYINAVDPEKVYIEESPVGLNFGSGDVRISSQAYKLIQGKKTDSYITSQNVYGSLKDNVITFPEKALLFSEMRYEKGAWFMVNLNKKFSVTLPMTTGVEALSVSDDDNVEYYNLQGIRVAKPQVGQVVIRRTASKVEKVILK